MYTLPIFAKDQVQELKDIPQSSVGAPCPMIIGDEHHLSVIYYLQDTPENWDGSIVRIAGPESTGEPYAIINFSMHTAYYHGSPNDEAFRGHPLYKKGLKPYGAFEIKESSWIQRFMEMNRVHPCHKDKNFVGRRHFVLAFHDSTFECVARSYAFETGIGSILEAANHVFQKFQK